MLELTARFDKTFRRWQEGVACNRPECGASGRIWRHFSDGIGSIPLGGKRYCFPVCFERELRDRFEQLRTPSPQPLRSTHRVPLGLLMLSRGELANAQLRSALAAQRQRGNGRIGEWIVELGFASEQRITAALAAQWSCPILRSFPERLPQYVVPLALLHRFRMAPAHYNESAKFMHVAFAQSIEHQALHAIEEVIRCRAEPCVTSPSALAGILGRMEDEYKRCEHVFVDSSSPEEMTRISASYAAKLRIEGVRLARCGDYVWIRLAAGTDSVNLLFTQAGTETHPAIDGRSIDLGQTSESSAQKLGAPPLTREAASPFPNAG